MCVLMHPVALKAGHHDDLDYSTIDVNNMAPRGVRLANVNVEELTFTWTLVDSTCSESITGYNISSNCGTCRNDTGTTATCSDLRLPSTCNFSIQNVICRRVGPASAVITITLRGSYAFSLRTFAGFMILICIVPNEPNVTFVPVYSADTQELIRFKAVVYQEVSEPPMITHSILWLHLPIVILLCRPPSIFRMVYLAQLLIIASSFLVLLLL